MNKVIKELQTAVIKSCGNGRAALGKDANVMRELIQWKLAVRIPCNMQSEGREITGSHTDSCCPFFPLQADGPCLGCNETAPGAGRCGMLCVLLMALLLLAG